MSIRVESSIRAIMIADSISESGIRLSTIQVTMPKFLLAQLNTHRMFSRNAASSRAIPTSKVIERVKNNPVVPIFWGKNKAGMQADEEITGDGKFCAEYSWEGASMNAAESAEELRNIGIHKQITNRLLEPFMYVDVLITATEWDNFFQLRLHDSTQPEMREVAKAIKWQLDFSIPEELNEQQWHLPYIKTEELAPTKDTEFTDIDVYVREVLIKCSVARCARVSYLNHDLTNPDLKKDLELYELLHKEKHLSPFEHQLSPMDYISLQVPNRDWPKGVTHVDRYGDHWSGNAKGWIQNRQLI